MTEAEWNTSTVPQLLVENLSDEIRHARKRRLCICAYSRLLLPRNATDVLQWIDTADRFADEKTNRKKLQEVNTLARCREKLGRGSLGFIMLNRATLHDASHANLSGAVHLIYRLSGLQESQLCDVIRDIFGNPFRPVAFDPDWRTSDAVAISRGMYESRDFAAMPILADALQDAGCENADILDHCRGPGPHVRGCWVVDQVLGKA